MTEEHKDAAKAAEARLTDAQAEIERLRTDIVALTDDYGDLLIRLADATALLRRHAAPKGFSDDPTLPSDTHAFFLASAQPAAPAHVTCGDRECTGPHAAPAQPAAPECRYHADSMVCGECQPAALYGTADESPGFNAAWPLGKPQPAAPRIDVPPGESDLQGYAVLAAFGQLLARPEPYPLGHGARHFPELYAEPAAPARTEACAHGQVGYCGACCLLDEPVPPKPARTEDEQAVLDACGGLELDEGPHKLMGIWEVWEAELARRGLE